MIRTEIINQKYTNYNHIIYMWEQKMISKEEYKILKDRFENLTELYNNI